MSSGDPFRAAELRRPAAGPELRLLPDQRQELPGAMQLCAGGERSVSPPRDPFTHACGLSGTKMQHEYHLEKDVETGGDDTKLRHQ